ncbi:protein fem-1 homolog A-like [Strongylocentrotus purpuratus]|uniref:Uncharacterized protein n=1 Tax=Strongylocentrotus purpuratus TaxID=7668 RepID=A0A7M7PI31_STRPU|nr:protein fem-1 homolog A-like [Strongylocentrotus purpuratus]
MALFSAAAKGDVLTIQSLIDSEDKSEDSGGVDVNCSDAFGYLEVVEYIVNNGADIEIGNKDGLTALHKASFKGHLGIVKYFVRKGAQLDKCNKNDRTPLFCATQEGYLEVVEYIVNNGADIEIDGGNRDIAEYLLKEGANINTCDEGGCAGGQNGVGA